MTFFKTSFIYLVFFVLAFDAISMQNNPMKRSGDDFPIDQQSQLKKQKIMDEEDMGTDFLEKNESRKKSQDIPMEEETDIPSIFSAIPSLDTTEADIDVEELSPQEIEKRADEFLNALYAENKDLDIEERDDIKESLLTGILYLDARELSSIPKEIGNLTHLYEANIAENLLSDLPVEIGKLKNLKYLGIGQNQFVEFPKQICNLKNLTELNANNNKFTDIPHEIKNLVHLKSLDISKNNIKYLPNTIGNLVKFDNPPHDRHNKIDLNNNPLEFLNENDTSWGWYELHLRLGGNFIFTTSPLYERYYLISEYIDNINNFSQMMYIDTPEKAKDVVEPIKYGMYKYVIFNQNSYEQENDRNDEKIGEIFHKGDPFILKEKMKNAFGQEVDVDIPIGYNIYVPEGDVKAIMVYVYGGGDTSTVDKIKYKPGVLGSFELYLLGQGIAIVTLNTFDLLQSEIYLQQPYAIHQIVQKSIHSFFNLLKNDYSPLCQSNRNLCKNLESLNSKKIFLFGSSFGGRTTLVQAETYPSTFDGYISHDGWLSLKISAEADLPLLNRKSVFDRAKTHPWLSAMTEEDGQSEEKITSIIRPILLLHNMDDHNVYIKATEAWYKKAREVIDSRKQNPLKNDMFAVRLHVTHEGNPIVPDQGFHNKGHFVPTDPASFKQYAETVSSFILNGPSKIMEFSDWTADRTGVISDKFYKAANYIDQFVSEAYPIYKFLAANKLQQHSEQNRVIGTPEDFVILEAQRAAIKTRNELDVDEIRRALKEGNPLEDIEALNPLTSSQALNAYTPFDTYERRKLALSTQKAIESEARAEVIRDWKDHYQNLYKIFALLNLYKNNIHEALKPIRSPGVMSFQNIQRALERQLLQFFKFLAEKYPEKPIAKYLDIVGGVQSLSHDKDMTYILIRLLVERVTPNDLKSYLFKTILFANPQFMDLYQINDLRGEKNAQEALIKVIITNTKNARKVFQGTVREVMNFDLK